MRLNHSKTATSRASSIRFSRASGVHLERTTKRQASNPKSKARNPKQIQSPNGELPKPLRPGASRALSHWDFEFASDFGLRVSDLGWPAPRQPTRARDRHIETAQPNSQVRGFHHIRRQCGSLSSSNYHFLPCSRTLLSLPVSRGISHRRVSIQMKIVAGHTSPPAAPSAQAAVPVASITSEDICSLAPLEISRWKNYRVGKTAEAEGGFYVLRQPSVQKPPSHHRMRPLTRKPTARTMGFAARTESRTCLSALVNVRNVWIISLKT